MRIRTICLVILTVLLAVTSCKDGAANSNGSTTTDITEVTSTTQKPATTSTTKVTTSTTEETFIRWLVTGITDGDTITVSRGDITEKVRLIGIDTPERGQCGYAEATDNLEALVDGEMVELIAGRAGIDNRDRYGRLLRYVDLGSPIKDAGLEQIKAGYAIARYDSRDDYGRHFREDLYVAADANIPQFACDATTTSRS